MIRDIVLACAIWIGLAVVILLASIPAARRAPYGWQDRGGFRFGPKPDSAEKEGTR